ncbi:hypothetical protein BC833DRAFT_571010, partial [Globomyces pollinis-pini]
SFFQSFRLTNGLSSVSERGVSKRVFGQSIKDPDNLNKTLACSKDAGNPVSVKITNMEAYIVDIYWKSASCELSPYSTLAANEEQSVGSFINHNSVAVNKKTGKIISTFKVESATTNSWIVRESLPSPSPSPTTSTSSSSSQPSSTTDSNSNSSSGSNSTIYIALVIGILLLIIVVGGIAYCMNRHKFTKQKEIPSTTYQNNQNHQNNGNSANTLVAAPQLSDYNNPSSFLSQPYAD